MRHFLDRATRTIVIAGASLALAGCGGDSADETANTLDSNLMFEDVANDQSALESAANATDMEPVGNEADNAATEADEPDEPEDEGTIESNVSGM